MTQVTIDQALAMALQHHHSGRLNEAEQIYRQILAVEPRHFDSLQLLGVIALNFGRLEDAIKLHRQALAIAPNVIAVRTNLARILRQAGRIEESLIESDAMLAIDPANLD